MWSGEWPIPGWRMGLDGVYEEIVADYEANAPERPIDDVAREMMKDM